MISLERIDASVDRLPVLPAVTQRLARMLGDDGAGPDAIDEVIRLDPVLTARLLAVANSAYFSRRRRIGSVRQAVVHFGRKRVYQLALAASLSRTVPRFIPGYGMEAETFWRHSVASAILSERLVRGPAAALDLTFTAGLLHDIGKLVIGAYLLEREEALVLGLEDERTTLFDMERELLGTDHCVVGELVARRWSLPDPIGFVARWHETPSEAPAGADRRLADVVHVASALAQLLGFGNDVGELLRHLDPDAVRRLGLEAAALERMACESVDDILETSKLFSEP